MALRKQVEQVEVVHQRVSSGNLLLVLLQLSVQPAVPLFLDKQDDDVAVLKAQECGIVARRVGEDGPDAGLSAHVETGRVGRGAGQSALAETPLICRQQRRKTLWTKIWTSYPSSSFQTYVTV